MIGVQLGQIGENIALHVLNQLFVMPNFIEPLLQLIPVTIIGNLKIQLDRYSGWTHIPNH